MTVEFKLGVASEVSVRIYNLRGERVTELFNGELGIGTHSFVWDGRDGRGSTVASR